METAFLFPSGAAASVLELSAMSAQEAEETQVDPTTPVACVKCGVDCTLDSGAIVKSGSLQCKWCTNIYQIMYRHIGGVPDGWNDLDAEDQKKFFKSSQEKLKAIGKNGRWACVKGALTTQLTHYHTEQTRTRINFEYLPLSVWKQRGFSTDDIVAKGEKKTCSAL